jgi:hypothetical protein
MSGLNDEIFNAKQKGEKVKINIEPATPEQAYMSAQLKVLNKINDKLNFIVVIIILSLVLGAIAFCVGGSALIPHF